MLRLQYGKTGYTDPITGVLVTAKEVMAGTRVPSVSALLNGIGIPSMSFCNRRQHEEIVGAIHVG